MSPQPTATPTAAVDAATFTPPVDLDAPLYTEADVADVLAPHIAAGRLVAADAYPRHWVTPGLAEPRVRVEAYGAWQRGVCWVEVGAVESEDPAVDRDGFDVRVGYASPGRVLDAVLTAAFAADRAAVAA